MQFADKLVVGEYYHRTIQINVIIHLNTGINMLTLFLNLADLRGGGGGGDRADPPKVFPR